LINTEAEAAAWLLTPQAVRVQSGLILSAGLDGGLEHFSVRLEKLPETARYVARTIHQRYPSLDIPGHSRWRHFVIGGVDRWQRCDRPLETEPLERARIRVELAITSVLLDAGAGAAWRFREKKTGQLLSRSEGLAMASLEMFLAGSFSSSMTRPIMADAEGLQGITRNRLATAFQVTDQNPLAGLEGRAALIRKLGEAVANRPDIFGENSPRLGRLVDYLVLGANSMKLPAARLLMVLLDALGTIWPGRLTLAGRNLGDTWQHSAAKREDAASGYVPFHKLTQWLCYSLIEPLNELGLEITDIGSLTGLAEYRNGGLLIDLGVLEPIEKAILAEPQLPSSEGVVEWRALTVALLDRLADLVRKELGTDELRLPLASILEGGTWAAGRRIAEELRPGGTPPIAIVSDGSVF